MLTYGIPPEFRGGVHLFIYLYRHTPSGQSRVYRSLPRVRQHRASKPQGCSKRVLPWQATLNQLICASLSHTHHWYEVSMLKVPAYTVSIAIQLIRAFLLRNRLEIACTVLYCTQRESHAMQVQAQVQYKNTAGTGTNTQYCI